MRWSIFASSTRRRRSSRSSTSTRRPASWRRPRLRSVLGQHDLDEMLAERAKLNADIQHILDEQTDAWGIKVANVELKHVDLNETMVRAIAKQAEAERIRRAKVIDAEGELQAAEKIAQAGADPRTAAGGDAASLSHRPAEHRRRALVHDRVSDPDRLLQLIAAVVTAEAGWVDIRRGRHSWATARIPAERGSAQTEATTGKATRIALSILTLATRALGPGLIPLAQGARPRPEDGLRRNERLVGAHGQGSPQGSPLPARPNQSVPAARSQSLTPAQIAALI